MKSNICVFHPDGVLKGTIQLTGSKSISNRVLLIRALSGVSFDIDNLSDSQDTSILKRLLSQESAIYDAHHAGTTFRFLTAYLALKPGEQILTGSERMKQRPIKPLVDALNELGADIEFVEKEGYPPLRIKDPKPIWKNSISLSSNVSSQFISALLLIAPVLKNGLQIHLNNEIVSESYINMTIAVMQDFGITIKRNDHSIYVSNQDYQPRDYHIESDWSSAAYYYAIAGLSKKADITINGLNEQSIQGDQAIVGFGKQFGVDTIFGDKAIQIIKQAVADVPDNLEINCINTPDLAQTIAVLCAGLGTQVLFSGLQTLHLKETDRVDALKTELSKLEVTLTKLPVKFSKKSRIEYYLQMGKASFPTDIIYFDSYEDHRMAMSFALLSVLQPVIIQHGEVVEKSYPNFWKDLKKLGFSIQETV